MKRCPNCDAEIENEWDVDLICSECGALISGEDNDDDDENEDEDWDEEEDEEF